MTPPDPQLKGAWYPGGFNPCLRPSSEKLVSSLCFQNATCARYTEGKDLERVVLAKALRYHLESRVLVHNNRTVVFD